MKQEKTRSLVLTALFVAIILVLGMTPIGLIPLGFINVTILCIPVIVGTVVLGLKTGLVLGACFGFTSVMSAFGVSLAAQSSLAAALLTVSPVSVILMSMVPRLMVPVVTHFVYKLASKGRRSKAGVIPAAIVGSLTNTILYLGLMLLFFVIYGLNSEAVLAIIGGTGIIAGSCEAIVAALIATPVCAALFKLKK